MNGIKDLIGKEICMEISGKIKFAGILIDAGMDIIVIYDGERYLYCPLLHVHNVRIRDELDSIQQPLEKSSIEDESNSFSYRKTLTNAKGRFVEIFVTGNRSIHGYITSVLNDYIVFYSPVYKTMLISMHHLKWLTPYHHQLTPYTLSNEMLPVVPTNITLSRSLEEQLQKYKGKLLVFDMGDNPDKIGLLKTIQNNIVELVTAEGDTVFWKLSHLKTSHFP
ncbi:DUF2642 domain-containing protein [Siminovitchia sediminis]|uniref:DUF2642 domain-containing protein n=1 Tax=Siminovitchia sediminis TaxID=1274353 RepID=A0ABW4KNN7_9BACI